MLLTPLPCHKLSHLLGPPPPSSVTYFMDGPLLMLGGDALVEFDEVLMSALRG